MVPLFVALQFLTRFPSPLRGTVSREHLGASIGWFPAVGVLIGAFLVLLDLGASIPRAPQLASWLEQLVTPEGGFSMTPGQPRAGLGNQSVTATDTVGNASSSASVQIFFFATVSVAIIAATYVNRPTLSSCQRMLSNLHPSQLPL